jgi:hypothetical protein
MNNDNDNKEDNIYLQQEIDRLTNLVSYETRNSLYNNIDYDYLYNKLHIYINLYKTPIIKCISPKCDICNKIFTSRNEEYIIDGFKLIAFSILVKNFNLFTFIKLHSHIYKTSSSLYGYPLVRMIQDKNKDCRCLNEGRIGYFYNKMEQYYIDKLNIYMLIKYIIIDITKILDILKHIMEIALFGKNNYFFIDDDELNIHQSCIL